MLRRAKATLRAALTASLLVLSGAYAQYEIPKDLPELAPSPVVAILTPPDGWGSGVAVKQKRYKKDGVMRCYEEILTAAHILSKGSYLGPDASPKLAMTVYNGKDKVPAAMLYWQPQYDLALVATDNEECMAKHAVEIYKGYLQDGMPVWAVGYVNWMGPMGSHGAFVTYQTYDWSYDTNVKGPFLVHTANTYSGMSGGAVIYRGMLVGMNLAVDGNRPIFNIAAPAWRIQQFLEDHRGRSTVLPESGRDNHSKRP